jgi:hypothetical protein
MDKYSLEIGLLSALIGACSGLFAVHMGTKYTAKAQDLSKRIEDLCESISKLEELSCTYWGNAKDDGKPSQHYILGVKTKISLLVSYLDSEYKQFSKESTSSLLAAFFDACTGGNFGSHNLTAEPERQRKILIVGEKLKIELMKLRLRLY